MQAALVRHQPVMLSILRIITALLFLEHGLMKLLQFPMPQLGAPQPLPVLLFAAAIIKTIGGSLLVLGLFNSPDRFRDRGPDGRRIFRRACATELLAGRKRGRCAVLFCFVFLTLIFTGGGRSASTLCGAAQGRAENRHVPHR